MKTRTALPKTNDLPRALPLAIAAALLALVLAPWLGSDEDTCTPRAETVSSVAAGASLMQAGPAAEPSTTDECG